MELGKTKTGDKEIDKMGLEELQNEILRILYKKAKEGKGDTRYPKDFKKEGIEYDNEGDVDDAVHLLERNGYVEATYYECNSTGDCEITAEGKLYVETNLLKKDNMLGNKKVFIVHGHDEDALLKVENFIRKMGLEPIVLREQADKGKTIIEKIEENTDVCYAIVIYTPCDEGKAIEEKEYKKRARQNVIFEHGFLCAKLGREKVCALLMGDTEIPSDLQGVLYKKFEIGWELKVAKEMKEAGIDIDLNKCV